MLFRSEEECKTLDKYFSSFLWKLSGFNSVFGNQIVIIDIISNLEEARNEALKDDYNHSKYRKLILDSFNLVDKIRESDGV